MWLLGLAFAVGLVVGAVISRRKQPPVDPAPFRATVNSQYRRSGICPTTTSEAIRKLETVYGDDD